MSNGTQGGKRKYSQSVIMLFAVCYDLPFFFFLLMMSVFQWFAVFALFNLSEWKLIPLCFELLRPTEKPKHSRLTEE